MSMIKKSGMIVLGASALMGASIATADVVPGDGTYNFEGRANLSQLFFTASGCLLEVTGDIAEDANGDITIMVTDAQSSNTGGGSSACNLVDLGVDPSDPNTYWYASVPGTTTTPIDETELPDPRYGTTGSGVGTYEREIQFNNVNIIAGFNCGANTVTAVFGNDVNNTATFGDPSYFDFDTSVGTCSVDGLVEAVGGDVDAFQ